jgi:hypothetical protein
MRPRLLAARILSYAQIWLERNWPNIHTREKYFPKIFHSRRDFLEGAKKLLIAIGTIALVDGLGKEQLRQLASWLFADDEYRERKKVAGDFMEAFKNTLNADSTMFALSRLPQNVIPINQLGAAKAICTVLRTNERAADLILEDRDGLMYRGSLVIIGTRFNNATAKQVYTLLNQKTLRLEFPDVRKYVEICYVCSKSTKPDSTMRMLDGQTFNEERAIIQDNRGNILQESIDSNGRPLTGILIISKLPHSRREGTILHISGTNGAATEAVRLLFDTPSIPEDKSRQFLYAWQTHSACQILFFVSELSYDRRLKRDMYTKIEMPEEPKPCVVGSKA